MLTPKQEYYARICERDALWDNFCDYPTEETWARYQEACDEVRKAEKIYNPVEDIPEQEDGIAAAGHGYGE